VFIYGENGTGKELVARSIHNKSARRKGRSVSLNCAAHSQDLVESELFGYEKGRSPAPSKRKARIVERADGRNALSDEVGDMGLETQAKTPARAAGERGVRLWGKGPTGSTCASSRPPTRTSVMKSGTDVSGRTCGTG